MIEAILILTALVAGLFWFIIRVVRQNAKTDAAYDNFIQQDQKRRDAENAGAKERKETADSNDAAIRDRLRKRSSKWRL